MRLALSGLSQNDAEELAKGLGYSYEDWDYKEIGQILNSRGKLDAKLAPYVHMLFLTFPLWGTTRRCGFFYGKNSRLLLNVSDLVRTIRKDDATEDRFKQIQSVDELKDTTNSVIASDQENADELRGESEFGNQRGV